MLQIRNLLNDIFSRNSKLFHRIVPHDALYQNPTKSFTPLSSHIQVSDIEPKGPLVTIFHLIYDCIETFLNQLIDIYDAFTIYC